MDKQNTLTNQIIGGVIVALLVGSSAPWWWKEVKSLFIPQRILNEVNEVPTARPFPAPTQRHISYDDFDLSIVIKDSNNKIIGHQNGNYFMRINETVTIMAKAIGSNSQSIKTQWEADYGKLSKVSANMYQYTVKELGDSHVTIRAWGTGEFEIERSVKFITVQ